MRSYGSRLSALIVLVVLLAGACTSESSSPSASDNAIDSVESIAEQPSGTSDQEATRDDIECDAETLGEDAAATFTVAHYVVDGRLGAVCYGEEDPTVVAAWDQLAAIAPQGQLGDLTLFAGFEGDENADDTTLAFVNTLDDGGSLFQMSINVSAARDDPAELLLTMAHEFSHVFTGLDTQLDRTEEAADSCETYFNGEGCYLPDSLMFSWIVEFWGDGLIDEIDPRAEATIESGQARCDSSPGFFGPYAASSPEEDFAESFSAYVFRIESATPEQQAKLDWIDGQAGLAEFRQRAVAAGLGPAENRFEQCG